MEDDKKIELTDEQKLRAAYALNMCTVSVSQIVDYDDEYILEQEYDAILNNLNLENIPKEEPLLNILVELLNTITFFRIQKLKKQRIEEKYQQRVKNAIWSAVPNFNMFVTGGHSAGIILSIVSQIGIGYMNYRREKAGAKEEKNDSDLQLKITAIEQFNAIRRELFTTAWRLADKYGFADKWRLTERQIEQYNSILMDSDEIRKYERLDSIKDNFEAYPPFWYFLGHSAHYIAGRTDICLTEDERNYYLKLSKDHFDKYQSLNKHNVLRTDELAAACDLEYLDLLLETGEALPEYFASRADLIDDAVKKSGNRNDILELCAVSYLRIDMPEAAEGILRNLVNESYNIKVNSKLLSRLYADRYMKAAESTDEALLKEIGAKYKLLAARTDGVILYPLPIKSGENHYNDNSNKEFMSEEKEALIDEYRSAIKHYIEHNVVEFRKIVPIPNTSIYAGDKHIFYDFDKMMSVIIDYFNDNGEMIDAYIGLLKRTEPREKIMALLNGTAEKLDTLSLFRESRSRDYLLGLIRKQIIAKREGLLKIQEILDGNAKNKLKLENCKYLLYECSYKGFTQDFYDALDGVLVKDIRAMSTMGEVDKAEQEIRDFDTLPEIEYGVKIDDRNIATTGYIGNKERPVYFDMALLGDAAKIENDSSRKKCRSIAEDHENELIIEPEGISFCLAGSDEFTSYFVKSTLKGFSEERDAFAVLCEDRVHSTDLIFTLQGIVYVVNGIVTGKYSYSDITQRKDGSIAFGSWPCQIYENTGVNTEKLYSLMSELARIL